jgi:long-chain acyl-CoA synthetase
LSDHETNLEECLMTSVQKECLERWCAEKPGGLAIVDGERRFTWSELNQASDAIAFFLQQRGIQSNDVVALRSQTRAEWVIVSIAVAKIDAVLLCLNWRLTASEVGFILRDSGAKALVCDDGEPDALFKGLGDALPEICMTIEQGPPGIANLQDLLSSAAPHLSAQRNARLLIYTSGTTGFPKGVVSPVPEDEQALNEYRADVASRGSQQRGDVVLINLPLHHGVGANQVHMAIDFGNTIVLMRRYDPELTLALIDEYRVSFWFAVPTMLKRLSVLPPSTLQRYDHRSLRAVMTGTAPVPLSLKSWVAERFGPILTEAYGATEAGLISALSPDLYRSKPGSSGTPYVHVSIRIKSDAGNPLPAPEVGEIWVKTPAVILSYLNAPRLGRDTLDTEGYFRTGDVGYLDQEGYLFITDRVKDMIISGGVNIYPAEIEAALSDCPGVLDVAAIGVPNEEFGEEIKAFCELIPGAQVTLELLLEHCASRLATFKRPRTIEIVDALPRNTMGKVLKRELRAPYWVGRERAI